MPVCALVLGIFAGAADAGEPQALLVAVQGEIALRCEACECAADVTTICLQRDRDMPRKGTVYDILAEAEGERPLRIVGLLADGGEMELAASAVPVSIAAERGHLAVKLSVPATVVDRFKLSHSRASAVMPIPGLDPRIVTGIHGIAGMLGIPKPWSAGTRPAMTQRAMVWGTQSRSSRPHAIAGNLIRLCAGANAKPEYSEAGGAAASRAREG